MAKKKVTTQKIKCCKCGEVQGTNPCLVCFPCEHHFCQHCTIVPVTPTPKVTTKKSKRAKKHTRCVVFGCQNHTDEGGFVGDLCYPCYAFLTNENSEAAKHGSRSAAFSYAMRVAMRVLYGQIGIGYQR